QARRRGRLRCARRGNRGRGIIGWLVSRLLLSLLILLPRLFLRCLGCGVHFGLGLRQRAAKILVALDVARQLLGEFPVEFFRCSGVAQRRGERGILVFTGLDSRHDVHTQRLVIQAGYRDHYGAARKQWHELDKHNDSFRWLTFWVVLTS